MEKLLEKDILHMLQLTAGILEENPLSLKKAATTQQVSVKTIRRLIAGHLNDGHFFDYHVNHGEIKSVQFTRFVSQKQSEVIAELFHKSTNLRLLISSMKNPFLTLSALSHTAYISASTLRRRFISFTRFLSPYLITIAQGVHPFIEGNERQIHFLLFRLTSFLHPSLYKSPELLYQHFHDIHTLRQAGLYTASSCSTTEGIFPRSFVPNYYLVNESSYLFLWKQLFSQETFFVPTKEALLMMKMIYPVINDNEKHPLAIRLTEIYQTHLICALLEGDIFVFQPVIDSFSETTLKLIRSFLLHLPHYEKLLKKHPELPLLYECIWQNISIFQPMITIKNACSC